MSKKYNTLMKEVGFMRLSILLLLCGLITLTFVSAGTLSGLEATAIVSGKVYSPSSDIDSGSCRTSSFSTDAGDIQIQACEKGDSIEVYRQEYPQGIEFNACFANACVDQNSGFSSKLTSELTNSTPAPSTENSQTPTETTQTQTETSTETLVTSPNSKNYAVSINDAFNGKTYARILEDWNDATWNDIVSDSFSGNLAAVRWYNTEGQCTGNKCENQLHNGNGAFPTLNVGANIFGGVTDEFSNVLLNFAQGNNQARYDKLHRFAEKLRNPNSNNLQCWKYYVTGNKNYNSYSDLCVADDSASDASIRILGAYSIACAKQEAGIWQSSDINYCADYEEQGRAIFGLGTASHGEVKKLQTPEGTKYYLANGYNNQVGSPTAYQSFRPDYYELQFLMDFAEYMNSAELKNGVLDMLDTYYGSLGSNMIHKGKTGKFSSDGKTGYQCTDLCAPEYLDNIDSWRAIPALSGLYNLDKSLVPPEKQAVFDYWWNNYLRPSRDSNSALPFEIYSNAENGKIKSSETSYKTLSMWIPLASAKDPSTAKSMLNQLAGMYRESESQFSGAAYYGGYFSQFAQRAIGEATGTLDPDFWTGTTVTVTETQGSSPPSQTETSLTESQATTDSTPQTQTTTSGGGSSGGGGGGGSSSSGAITSPETLINQTTLSTPLGINSLNDFQLSCKINDVECAITKDQSDGSCRTVSAETSEGRLKTKICEKSEGAYEIYRQQYPKKENFEFCFANFCIDENTGFQRFQGSEILSEEQNTDVLSSKITSTIGWVGSTLAAGFLAVVHFFMTTLFPIKEFF